MIAKSTILPLLRKEDFSCLLKHKITIAINRASKDPLGCVSSVVPHNIIMHAAKKGLDMHDFLFCNILNANVITGKVIKTM
jgi:hypothetical protein